MESCGIFLIAAGFIGGKKWDGAFIGTGVMAQITGLPVYSVLLKPGTINRWQQIPPGIAVQTMPALFNKETRSLK